MKNIKLLSPFVLILLPTIWCALAFRFDAILISSIFFLALLIPYIRKNYFILAFFVSALTLYPFQPVSITLMNMPGPPKLLRNCHIVGLEGIEGAYLAQKRGECIVASDIGGSFEPSIYMVW